MAEKRERRRVGQRWKRIIAVVLSIMLIVTLLPVIPEGKDADAAVVANYPVTIDFFDVDKEKEQKPEGLTTEGDKQYYVVVSLYENEGDEEPVAYGYEGVYYLSTKAHHSVTVNQFYDITSGTEAAGWQTKSYTYDDANINTVRVRFYYGSFSDNRGWPGASAYQYNQLIAGKDTFDGYAFDPDKSTAGKTSATICIYKDAGSELDLDLKFSPNGATIPASENLYIVARIKHETTGYTYYISPLVTTGNDTERFVADKWYTSGGVVLGNEKFTGNEQGITVGIYKMYEKYNSAPEALNIICQNNADKCRKIVSGDLIQGYTVAYDETENKAIQDALTITTDPNTFVKNSVFTLNKIRSASILPLWKRKNKSRKRKRNRSERKSSGRRKIILS